MNKNKNPLEDYRSDARCRGVGEFVCNLKKKFGSNGPYIIVRNTRSRLQLKYCILLGVCFISLELLVSISCLTKVVGSYSEESFKIEKDNSHSVLAENSFETLS